MIVPQDAWEVVEAATKTVLPPPVTPPHTHTPLPTVVPPHPKIYHQTASDVGGRTLWVVVVLMAISSLAFYGMAMRVPVQKRLFHILTSFITTFAFLSYMAMALGNGKGWQISVTRETKQHIVTMITKREVYWARYVDWSLTTPLLLIDLALLAGLNGAGILITVVADVIMVLTGLFAAFGRNDQQRWAWYAVACIAFLTIIYQLGYNGRAAVANKDNKTKAFFTALALYTLVLWAAYPIIWGIADGAHKINVDGEIIAYAVLDILAKPVFGFWLLTTHDTMSRTSPSIEGFWAHGISHEGALRVGEGDDD